MPTLKLEIPQETFEQLLAVASRDWRPTVWQAEWLLRRAIAAEVGKDHEAPVPATTTGAQD